MSHYCWTSNPTTSGHSTLEIHCTTIPIPAFNSSTHSLTGSRALAPVTFLLNYRSRILVLLSLHFTSLLHHLNKPSCTHRSCPPTRENPHPTVLIILDYIRSASVRLIYRSTSSPSSSKMGTKIQNHHPTLIIFDTLFGP